jgi:hypothetical protein
LFKLIRSKEARLHGDNLDNVRCEINKTFRNKRSEYLKKIELEKDSKHYNIRNIYEGLNELRVTNLEIPL